MPRNKSIFQCNKVALVRYHAWRSVSPRRCEVNVISNVINTNIIIIMSFRRLQPSDNEIKFIRMCSFLLIIDSLLQMLRTKELN